MADRVPAPPPGVSPRLGPPLACLAVVMLLGFAHYLRLAFDAVRFPFELDYGEGIVWQQMRMIADGQGYAPLQAYPAIVFHYPPLYHLASAGMAALSGLDQLAAGRLVSILSTVLAAGIAGLIVAEIEHGSRRLAVWAGALCAGLAVFTTEPMLIWSILMRVDMLFVLLSFAGVWLGMRALRQPALIHGAALCFVGAIFTKQTAIAAPLAVFAVSLAVRPRTALAGMATGLAAAVAALLWLSWQTHGEFLHHIVAYNMNRFAGDKWEVIAEALGKHFGLVLVAGITVWRRVQALRATARGGLVAHLRSMPGDAALAMVLLHLAIATVMLGLIFKSGSSVNYFLEWLFLVAICVGLGIAAFVRSVDAAPRNRVTAALPWLAAAQCFAFPTLFETEYELRVRHAGDYARIAQAMRAAPAPIVSDDMVLLLRAGKPVVMEPSIFAELSAKNVLDDGPLIDRVNQHKFAFFLTEGWPGDPVYDSRYTPRLSAAILAAYPQRIELAQYYELRFPAGALPAWAAGLRRK